MDKELKHPSKCGEYSYTFCRKDCEEREKNCEYLKYGTAKKEDPGIQIMKTLRARLMILKGNNAEDNDSNKVLRASAHGHIRGYSQALKVVRPDLYDKLLTEGLVIFVQGG